MPFPTDCQRLFSPACLNRPPGLPKPQPLTIAAPPWISPTSGTPCCGPWPGSSPPWPWACSWPTASSPQLDPVPGQAGPPPSSAWGHLKDVVGASFSMAFFSGMAANSLLAEAHWAPASSATAKLILANLFNSLPTYFLHLPQMFFITVPFLGTKPAGLYVGLTLLAALLRTAAIPRLGHLPCRAARRLRDLPLAGQRVSWKKAWQGLETLYPPHPLHGPFYRPHLYRHLYLAVFGIFDAMEKWLSNHLSFLSFMTPQAVSIVMFRWWRIHGRAGRRGAMLGAGDLTTRQVVLACWSATSCPRPCGPSATSSRITPHLLAPHGGRAYRAKPAFPRRKHHRGHHRLRPLRLAAGEASATGSRRGA